MAIDLVSLTGTVIGFVALCLVILILRILKRISRKIEKIEREKGARTPEKTEKIELESASDRKVDYLYKYFRINESIEELDRFTGTYVQFLDHVEEELKELQSGKVEGPEYFRRQRLVEFALNMALVYARVEGDIGMIPKIKKYWEQVREIR